MGDVKPKIVRTDSREASLLDWSTIEAAINSDEFKSDSRGRSFLLVALHTYFDLPPALADDVITDGGGDRGIDAIIIDESRSKLELITSKSVAKFDAARRTFPGSETDKILQFLDDLLRKSDTLRIHSNPRLRSKVEAVWEFLQSGNRFDITVHVFSNMSDMAPHDRERLRSGLQQRGVALSEAHLSSISDGLAHNFDPPASRTLKFLDQQRFDGLHGGIRMLVGNCLLSDVARFVAVPDTAGELDRRLLHQNVRGVLEGAQPIHESILATLSSDKVQWFPYLNNGLTIVCDSIKTQLGGNFPVYLERPQIVNGAQTVSCIRLFASQANNAFDLAVVTVKVIETRERGLREEIAVATNSQARVYSRDLRANEDVAKKLSSGVERLGYFYKRRRGDAAPLKSDRIIDAVKLGQIIYATILDAPTHPKTKTNEIFGGDFDRIFDPEVLTPEAAISLHIFEQVARRFKDVILSGMRKSDEGSFAESWVGLLPEKWSSLKYA